MILTTEITSVFHWTQPKLLHLPQTLELLPSLYPTLWMYSHNKSYSKSLLLSAHMVDYTWVRGVYGHILWASAKAFISWVWLYLDRSLTLPCNWHQQWQLEMLINVNWMSSKMPWHVCQPDQSKHSCPMTWSRRLKPIGCQHLQMPRPFLDSG